MIRTLHRWPGLLAAVLLIVLSLSGAILSVLPAIERLSAPQAETTLSVADLTSNILATHPGVEQIRRAPSGRITAYWFEDGTPGAAVVDPATGSDIGSADPNQFERWITDFHRSLFLGDSGRIAMAIAAAAMLVLSVTGAQMVARRTGGWSRWFSTVRGPLSGRLHVEIARVAVVGLTLLSVTALYMSASTFGFIDSSETLPAFPSEVSLQTDVAIADIETLQSTSVSHMRELTFPYPGDPTDVFTLKTDQGTGYIDQGTGALLSWADLSTLEYVSETIYMLHTGHGAAALGLILGVMALGIPLMAVTGFLLWLASRRARPKLKGNVAAARAETIVLVGSEGGSTWGFAATLHKALTAAGQTVHAAPLSSFAPNRYAKAKRIVILAATYGDGDAPASAKGFLDKLNALPQAPAAPLSVLGFGDRSFADFCAYAENVAQAAAEKGWAMLTQLDTVDRQSPQDFTRWGRALGDAMGTPLELVHQPVLPAAQSLTLISRRDYGAEVQAPTAILRFALPHSNLWQRLLRQNFNRFEPGDLIGLLPEGSAVPRFYSLASGSSDRFVEIVVKKHPGGLCSGQLMALKPGDKVTGFLRRNPGFHLGKSKAPLILIGAGTGIGPLAGFTRANTKKRPIHLFFGMRHENSDFLYETEIEHWQSTGKLTRVVTAVSRSHTPSYVQNVLRAEAADVFALIQSGARIMVCGGRDMANGVSVALAEILAPAGLTPSALKAQGRYVEDVY